MVASQKQWPSFGSPIRMSGLAGNALPSAASKLSSTRVVPYSKRKLEVKDVRQKIQLAGHSRRDGRSGLNSCRRPRRRSETHAAEAKPSYPGAASESGRRGRHPETQLREGGNPLLPSVPVRSCRPFYPVQPGLCVGTEGSVGAGAKTLWSGIGAGDRRGHRPNQRQPIGREADEGCVRQPERRSHASESHERRIDSALIAGPSPGGPACPAKSLGPGSAQYVHPEQFGSREGVSRRL